MFNAALAIGNIASFLLHMSNARTAKRLGANPASSYMWAGLSAVLAIGFGAAAIMNG